MYIPKYLIWIWFQRSIPFWQSSKVQVFWGGHKILCNLPDGFDVTFTTCVTLKHWRRLHQILRPSQNTYILLLQASRFEKNIVNKRVQSSTDPTTSSKTINPNYTCFDQLNRTIFAICLLDIDCFFTVRGVRNNQIV